MALVRSLGIAGVLLVSVAALATAQEPATSFAALQARLKPGRTVTVTESAPMPSGKPRATKGELVEVKPGAVVIKAHGQSTTFAEADVAQVTERYRYSSNALTIGLIAGAAGGLALDRLLVHDVGADMSFGADDAVVVGVGAALGAALALHPRQRVVYRKAPAATLVVMPLLGPRRIGFAGRIGF